MSTALPKKISKRILGIDFGMKRLGLALSDERQIIATPLQTVLSEKKIELTTSKILSIVSELEIKYNCEIVEIVVGMPLKMSGQLGLSADEVVFFVRSMMQKTTIPITTWDERLSTVQAERSLRETSMSRKKRSKVVDIVSAAIILQSYLDFKKMPLNYE